MGWFTTQGNENMRDKARRVAAEKKDAAKSAANPKNIAANARDKRHDKKGGAFCAGCGKPIKGVKSNKGNVHNKAACQRKAAESYKSVMDRDW